ncbi:4Fe-4S dicluster domain-containing protein [Candidatus Amarolinea dominans]|uniref:4Fe-4S dicluster domain-containing protein n=1 Tax=Candidatus Amarolinea dominans TaxID=3140696 RepID=UPI001D91A9CF|nr:4Fe-4S dicluster domain-containing protein [Anaerolineae bacterium]
MNAPIMTQAALEIWLTNLLPDHTVIAPQPQGQQIVFAPLAQVSDIAWDAGRTDLSAKEFFLPASEAIITLRPSTGGLQVETTHLTRPQVIFGARPCDGHALEVLDRLFLDDPVDVYYAERRAMTTMVGLACSDGPWTGCFCTALGGGPSDRTHLDILLTACDGGFAVDVVTDKGRALLEAGAAVLASADVALPAPPVVTDLQVPVTAAWRAAFNAPYWAELAERCLGCRTCTYDCPVCYCFDVRDRVMGDGSIERLRCWDSCQGALCFAIAGGHNPRPTQAARQRQRYMHKFLYYPGREGAALCVGCGRCVEQCPVNIDIREVIGFVAANNRAAAAEVQS